MYQKCVTHVQRHCNANSNLLFSGVLVTVNVHRASQWNRNRQPSNGQKFNRQPSKKQLLSAVKRFQGLLNLCFSCSSRTAGSQRIILTGTTSFHFPKNTHFTVSSTHLRLNWHFNCLLPGNTSGFKILMINCIDRNKKVNMNFNSWKKSSLDNRQSSKTLKFNRQPSKSAKFNRQPSKLHPH